MTQKNNTPHTSGEKATQQEEKLNQQQEQQLMGVERFLQLEPQTSGVAAILRQRYKAEVYPQYKWKELLEGILNRKVR